MSHRPPRPTESPHDPTLTRLCELADRRATTLGHELSHWEAPPGEEGLALRAYCKRCSRTIYVRAEDGLAGVAGAASTEACT